MMIASITSIASIASIASQANAQTANAGDEVFSSTDPDQPCGMIVNAERLSESEMLCLVEIKVAAVKEGTVHLGSAQGSVLQFNEMPYPA
jgi:folate-binding Fe-S cluster repair protein YgfZ